MNGYRRLKSIEADSDEFALRGPHRTLYVLEQRRRHDQGECTADRAFVPSAIRLDGLTGLADVEVLRHSDANDGRQIDGQHLRVHWLDLRCVKQKRRSRFPLLQGGNLRPLGYKSCLARRHAARHKSNYHRPSSSDQQNVRSITVFESGHRYLCYKSTGTAVTRAPGATALLVPKMICSSPVSPSTTSTQIPSS